MTAEAAVIVGMDKPEIDGRTGSLGVNEEAAGRLNDRVSDEGFVENRGSEASDTAGGTIPTPAVRNVGGQCSLEHYRASCSSLPMLTLDTYLPSCYHPCPICGRFALL